MDQHALVSEPLATTSRAIAAATTPQTRGFLSFTLGDQLYGIDIRQVREIRSWTPVTSIPDAPPHILGILNLRGDMVPVVDLRKRFALADVDYTPLTVVVVVSVRLGERRHTIGLVVDGVSDVLETSPDRIQQAPDLGATIATDFIDGLLQQNQQLVLLLRLQQLVNGGELFRLRTPPSGTGAEQHHSPTSTLNQ